MCLIYILINVNNVYNIYSVFTFVIIYVNNNILILYVYKDRLS